MDNNQIDFVVRHYRKGRFSTAAGWRRLGIARPAAWRRHRVAAAIAATVILSATAAIIYNEYHAPDIIVEMSQAIADDPMREVKVIDFDGAPLVEVVTKIESVYGVKVERLPEHPDSFALSLHYEGSPVDLIATINEILGTEMTVVEK